MNLLVQSISTMNTLLYINMEICIHCGLHKHILRLNRLFPVFWSYFLTECPLVLNTTSLYRFSVSPSSLIKLNEKLTLESFIQLNIGIVWRNSSLCSIIWNLRKHVASVPFHFINNSVFAKYSRPDIVIIFRGFNEMELFRTLDVWLNNFS